MILNIIENYRNAIYTMHKSELEGKKAAIQLADISKNQFQKAFKCLSKYRWNIRDA